MGSIGWGGGARGGGRGATDGGAVGDGFGVELELPDGATAGEEPFQPAAGPRPKMGRVLGGGGGLNAGRLPLETTFIRKKKGSSILRSLLHRLRGWAPPRSEGVVRGIWERGHPNHLSIRHPCADR